MKFTKHLALAAAGLLALAMTAGAQLGFDAYKTVRTYSFGPQINLAAGTPATNSAIDRATIMGIGYVDIISATNFPTTGTLTATVLGAADKTNWATINNFAIVTGPTSVSYTNWYYAGASTNPLVVVNSVLLPGTITAPTAYTAGFATPYLAYLPFTNTGSFAVTPGVITRVAFNLNDQPRYLSITYTAVATAGTNIDCSAFLTAPNLAYP